MEQKKIILPSKRYFKAPEEDINLNLNLDNNNTLLREGDMDVVLNLNELFDKERNKSNQYKIYGKIKMLFRNLYSGSTTYDPLEKNLYLVDDGSLLVNSGYVPYNEFAFMRNDVIREVNVPTSGTSITTYQTNVQITGYTGHTAITSIEAPYHNWNLYLSYVYSSDTEYPMVYSLSGGTSYSFKAKDGIPFRVEDMDPYYVLTSPVEHGMNQGEFIIISGGTLNGTPIEKNTIYIDSVGNEIYDSEKYVINLLKSEFTSGFTLSGVTFVTGKRCLNIKNITGTTSQYYVHKHKTITTQEDYILDKIGFETSLWRDEKKILYQNLLREEDVLVERNRMESVLFDFKKSFTLTGITNNLGYTPTEVYATILLRNGNGFFTYPPKVGFKYNFHNSWIDDIFIGSTETSISGTTTFNGKGIYSGLTFSGGTTIPSGTTLTGAFVEYNFNDFNERIISEAFHKFSHRKKASDGTTTLFDYGQDGNVAGFSGATTGNTIGYYYQPHHRIKLRQLSPYIEVSNTKDILFLPDNTKYDSVNKVWKWRDLYDHGFVDTDGNGTNFPFINNTHHVMSDINFYLRNEQTYTNKQDLPKTGFTFYNSKNNC